MQGITGKYKINIRNVAIAIAALLCLFVVWNYAAAWAPSRSNYEVQGIILTPDNDKPVWSTLGATGVDFVYLTATEGTQRREKALQDNIEGAMQAGIRVGILHHFDICRLASDQADIFITSVPRIKNALPPAVQMDFHGGCSGRPNRGLILSEIATFLSKIEVHSGVPAILLLDREFEQEYQVSKSIDRNVWLESNWFLPDYSARPWVMWTANSARHIDGVERPVRWAVVRN